MLPKKQIISSRSFGQLIHTLPELSESIASHASSAAEKLRRQNGACGAIQVFVQTNPFREQDPQYSRTITVPLPNESSDTRLLVRVALFGLKRIYRRGYAYEKAGVMLTGVATAAVRQASLLAQHGSGEKSERLMHALDSLNQRYGRNTVSLFSAGTDKSWAMRRENMSPGYTTNWKHVPVAHAR